MSKSYPTAAPPAPRPPWFRRYFHWWQAVLAAVLVLIAADSFARVQHLEALASAYGVQVSPPPVAAQSPTGYELGRRNYIEPGNSTDTYHWVMQTQEMLAGGPWRLHHVDYDNAPAGRAMHWASPPRWGLALLAELDHLATGVSTAAAVEAAVLVANPLLLMILLLILIPILARRFGGPGAALLAVGTVASYPFYLNFIAGNAEHQGAAAACALVTVVGLLGGSGGWIRREGSDPATGGGAASPAQARRWFLASAVAGGLGLWLSAASEAPVLAGAGLGGLVALSLGNRRSDPAAPSPQPELWRLWGAAGCAVSLAAYAIEYFPGQMGWRLEVNHPLYALAWLGGGELLCQWGRWRRPAALRQRAPLSRTLGALVLVAVLPGVILLAPDRTFWVADPFLWHLHTDYIAEFHPMGWELAHSSWDFAALGRLVPLFLVLPPALYLGLRGTPRFWKAQLALAVIPAAVDLGLAIQQLRWWGLASGLVFISLLPLLALVAERGRAGGRRAPVWPLACALLLAPGAIHAVQLVPAESTVTVSNLWGLADRDIGQWLRLRAGNDPVVVLSTPNTTTSLIYHGSVRGLGTLYWENRDGLKAAAEIFSARSPEAARALLAQHGITHIVLVSWDPFAPAYVQLARSLPLGARLPADSFASVLTGGGPLPSWLRLLPYTLPSTGALQGQQVSIFEITPPQRPVDVLVRNAAYLVEMGHPEAAGRLRPALRTWPTSFAALAELARIEGELGDANGVETTMEQLGALGPEPASLAAEDQIRLAVAFSIGGRIEAARQVIEHCLASMDERTLRHLTSGTDADLLSLIDHLGVSFPDPTWRRIAIELVPPRLR